MKCCSKCGENRILKWFYTDRANRDSLKTNCQLCSSVRRANREKGNSGVIDYVDAARVFDKQGGLCAITGEKLVPRNISLDHINSNGYNIIGNIQWVTKRANSIKHRKSLEIAMIEVINEGKYCPVCEEVKSLSEFDDDPRSNNGNRKHGRCKNCYRKYMRKYMVQYRARKKRSAQ